MAKQRINLFESEQYQVIGTAMFFMEPAHRPIYLDGYYAAFNNSVKYYNTFLADSPDVKEVTDTYFSGPVRYGNKGAIKDGSVLVGADLVSAYALFLIDNILPGTRRTKYDGYVAPKGAEINIYTFEFAEKNPSPKLTDWFLAKESFSHKIQNFGDNGVKGRINIMASKDRFELYELFREAAPSAKVISTVTCFGKEKVYINRENLRTRVQMKFQGNKISKKMLTQSMGNLSHLDKPSFYWMVQCVKARVLTQLIKNVPHENIVAMNTDGVIIAFDEHDIDAMANYVMATENWDVVVEIGIEVKTIGTQVFQERK